MRSLGRLLLWSLAGLLAVGLLLPFVLLEAEPGVSGMSRLDAAHLARARALLREYGPGRQRDGEEKTVELSAQELSMLLTALVHGADGLARASISEDTLTARFTWQVPANPLGRFVNLTIVLGETGELPDLERIGIGRLTVPQPLGRWLVSHGLRAVAASQGLSEVESLIREVRLRDGALRLRYEWRERVADAVRLQLIPPDEQSRMRAFNARLVEVAQDLKGVVTLPAIAAPLFALAAERAAKGSDPIADNRAAMMVLVIYLTGRHATQVVPEAANWPVARRLSVRVHRRVDLVEHFAVSAVLAAAGGEAMADALGVSKELNDARSGSGFSFVDLLADTAGTRFGERATDSAESARQLQQLAATAMEEDAWVPSHRGLREQMTEDEFKTRFGGVEGAAFREAVADIERRLADSPLYH